MRIPIVNEQDEIIGYKDSKDRGPKDICRIAGLWVLDPEGNILLAQRSFNKKHDPGVWSSAAAGTVEEGETYESNIIKEAEEELGITGIQPKPLYKIRVSTSHEYFSQAFLAVVPHDYPFKKQDDEVEEFKWFSKDEVKNFFKENPDKFIKSFKQHLDYFLNNENQS